MDRYDEQADNVLERFRHRKDVVLDDLALSWARHVIANVLCQEVRSERERCAKIADEVAAENAGSSEEENAAAGAALEIASLIRSDYSE